MPTAPEGVTFTDANLLVFDIVPRYRGRQGGLDTWDCIPPDAADPGVGTLAALVTPPHSVLRLVRP